MVGQYTKLGHRPFSQYPFHFIIINFSKPESPAMTKKNYPPPADKRTCTVNCLAPNRCSWNNIKERTVPHDPTNLCSKFFFVTELWNA